MSESLAWLATTADGEALGQAAARSVQIVHESRPWWAFAAEPMHWFYSILGIAPHSFYAAALFLAIAALAGWWASRQGGWRAGLAWTTTLAMTLVGGMQAHGWLYTRIPYGIRFQLPANAQFRLANLHCHTQASGGVLMPADALRWHISKGFSVVGVTDSNKTYPGLRASSEAGDQEIPVVVVPGEEYRGTTHLLMFGLKEPIRADQTDISSAMASARQQGALVIAAHTWTGKQTPEQLVQWGAAGFEACNGPTTVDQATLALARQHQMALLGSLDFRQGNSPKTATVLPLWADTPEKVLEALRKGQCATLYSPDWREDTRFSYWVRLKHNFPDLVFRGGIWVIPGLASWYALARLARRHAPCQPRKGLENILVLALGGGIMGIWAVWWRYKLGWFPSLELALSLWVVACPLSWYMAGCEWLRGRERRQQAL
ncbi:MAG: hypothetical protein U0931_34300 [Vulcanimicrobiota bacterium]